MKRTVSVILMLSLVLSLVSCMGLDGGDIADFVPGGVDSDYSVSTEGAVYGSKESPSGDSSGSENGDDGQMTAPPSGMITAGAWSDNDNYELWRTLFEQESVSENTETSGGKFSFYSSSDNSWGFDSLRRVSVDVTSGGEPVAGATVIARDADGKEVFRAVSDAQGRAYAFTSESEGTLEVRSGDLGVELSFTENERELTAELASHAEKLNTIELMLVVDVTGSMGDELSYLKSELADVIRRISENDENTVIKLALLFYRDTDDEVPLAYYDFEDVTTESGMSKMQKALNAQSASGGGDTPEAVDLALDTAVGKQWSTGSTTKIIFHILDAPAHNTASAKKTFAAAVKKAAEKGIRICPVICSGADRLTEYTMREAAIYTGGTFIFVTDDSGIGNPHHDPELPNVTVELLGSMLVRLTMGYHTGTFDSPIYWRDDPALAK